MQYSEAGLRLTEGFEGVRLRAYLDSRGIPTIGYGHTKGVQLGVTCTPEQAEAWLAEDEAWAVSIVNSLVHVPLTQGEFDVLVDFTFNCGSGTLQHSTLLQSVNKCNWTTVAKAFEEYDHAGGKVVAGLLRRRVAEAAEFSAK